MLVHQIIIISTKELHQKHYLLFYYTEDELYRILFLVEV